MYINMVTESSTDKIPKTQRHVLNNYLNVVSVGLDNKSTDLFSQTLIY